MNDLAKVTLISGKAIASTLKTVSTLGEIGKKILDSAGIQEIDLEGWYPSNLRIQMFDETFERFGSEALFFLESMSYFLIVMPWLMANN